MASFNGKNLKNILESHPVFVLLTIFVFSFGAGWAALSVVQSAVGLTTVTTERLAQLEQISTTIERYDEEARTARVHAAELSAQLKVWENNSPSWRTDLAEEISVLRSENQFLLDLVARNGGENASRIYDIALDPPSPSRQVLGREGSIIVSFQYSIEEGKSASIWAYGVSSLDDESVFSSSQRVSSSSLLSGNGSLRRSISLTRPGSIRFVYIVMRSDKDRLLADVLVPAEYSFHELR